MLVFWVVVFWFFCVFFFGNRCPCYKYFCRFPTLRVISITFLFSLEGERKEKETDTKLDKDSSHVLVHSADAYNEWAAAGQEPGLPGVGKDWVLWCCCLTGSFLEVKLTLKARLSATDCGCPGRCHSCHAKHLPLYHMLTCLVVFQL